ncbi:MAG: hypothetical protein ACLU6O_11105 [Bilophila wadsworthia]
MSRASDAGIAVRDLSKATAKARFWTAFLDLPSGKPFRHRPFDAAKHPALPAGLWTGAR